VIKLRIAPNGNQTITKVCNMCGCHIDNLEVEDILVKKPSDARVFDKDGNEITRTKLPTELTECKCENCND
jgi:hypothetical protein|tara:strand:- start:397 stop:609 length:213 start_codon:yes stop_codon:yes gene_type:complete